MKSYMAISTMNGIYEQLVLRKPQFDSNEGIYFVVRIRADNYGYERDGNTFHDKWKNHCYRCIHIIMLKNHQVFIKVLNEFSSMEIPQTGWRNTSNHDSCWRSGSDEITRLGFDCWDEAFKTTPEEHRPETKSDGLTIRIEHGILGSIFKLVKVEKEPDYENDDRGYFEKITMVKEIKHKLVKDEY